MRYKKQKMNFTGQIDHTATGTLRDSIILSSNSNLMVFLSLPIFKYSSNRSFKSSVRFVVDFHPRTSLAALGSA